MSIHFSRTTLISLLFLATLVIPLTVYFSQKQQRAQQFAANLSISLPVGISPGYGFEDIFGKMSSSQQQTVINQMKSDGVQWLRLDYWSTDTFDYQFIKQAEAAGINVDVLLENFDATPTQWSNLASQTVATMKPLGVHTYEILNEVNTYKDPNRNATITASQYAIILKAAYPAIKAADPTATVLLSGLDMSGNPTGYLQGIYSAGGKDYFDAVNAHPYTFYPSMPAPTNCSADNAFCAGLPALHTVMQNNGDGNKKIWITEFGCPTGTDAGNPAACTDSTLSQQITQAYNQAKNWGWIGSFFLFSWQDTTGDGDFGLYTANGSPKSSAIAAFTQLAAGSLPAQTPTPTQITANTPTLSLQNPTIVHITVCPHGLGNCGDNAISSGGNSKPTHTQRTITLTVFDAHNQQVTQQQGQVSYIIQAQNFQGSIPLTNIPSGNYTATIKMDGFLSKQLPGIISLTQGQSIQLPEIRVITGDINADNHLNIIDYSILMGCYSDLLPATSCTSSQKQQADINDDGQVNQLDYNLFLRELSNMNGE